MLLLLLPLLLIMLAIITAGDPPTFVVSCNAPDIV
jgi:hypothetical protein